MGYLALGLLALAVFIAITGGMPVLKRREWRVLSAAMALAAFTAGAFVGVRGKWGTAVVLVVVGLWLAASARKTRAVSAQTTERMSVAEARRILGVGPEATREEIQAAYTRLMRMAHPDRGGTAGLAAQLNAARERLLNR